jgi:hypothetical protein
MEITRVPKRVDCKPGGRVEIMNLAMSTVFLFEAGQEELPITPGNTYGWTASSEFFWLRTKFGSSRVDLRMEEPQPPPRPAKNAGVTQYIGVREVMEALDCSKSLAYEHLKRAAGGLDTNGRLRRVALDDWEAYVRREFPGGERTWRTGSSGGRKATSGTAGTTRGTAGGSGGPRVAKTSAQPKRPSDDSSRTLRVRPVQPRTRPRTP